MLYRYFSNYGLAQNGYRSISFIHCICSNLQGCGSGNPLGMGNSYWCSDVERNSRLEIRLSKTQRITSAIVDVINGQDIRGFALLAKNANRWDPLSFEEVMTLLHTF